MTRNTIFAIALLLLAPLAVMAQKEYKPLRTFISKGGNAAQINATIAQLKQDIETKDDPHLYYLAAEVQRKINDVDNEKLFLKQPYDTVGFFNSIHSMFDNLMTCNKMESVPDKKGHVKAKHLSKSRQLAKTYYTNLYNGGLFFMKKRDYANANRFLTTYLDAASSPLLVKDNILATDSKVPRVASWLMTCRYELKDYAGVFQYDSLSLRDSANVDLYLQYRALAYAGLNDTAHFVSELYSGMKAVPSDEFFFCNLTEYYNNTHQYQHGLRVTDSLLAASPSNPVYRFTKCVILYNMKRYDECIPLIKTVLENDPNNADAYFYLGSCYFNKAQQQDDQLPPSINARNYQRDKLAIQQLYEQAATPLESYSTMRPEAQSRWAPLLYKTYLMLNREQQFSKMEELLRNQQAQKK